jgi:hypothetical protein
MPDRRRFSASVDQPWSDTLYASLYFSPQHPTGFAGFYRQGRTGPLDRLIVHSPYWADVKARVDSFNANEVELIPALLISRQPPMVGLSVDDALTLPEGTLRKGRRDIGDRFWHLKLYWAEQGNRRLLALGSCNFTKAGLAGSGGNVESMLVFEVGEEDAEAILPPRAPFDGDLPTEAVLEEDAPEPALVRIAVIYDWRKSVYHWYYEPDHTHCDPLLDLEGLSTISLTRVDGTLSAPGPKRLGRFTVHWNDAGVACSFRGLVTEINLEFSEKTYGTPLTASAILEAWRGKHTPISTGAERDDSGASDEEMEAPQPEQDPFAVVNLYDVYRAFRDVSFRLQRYADQASARALLVARPDSVFALARLASNHSSSLVVRYLVLREAKGLLHRFSPGGEQFKSVRDWTTAARAEVRRAIAEDPTIQARGTNPDRLLDWFERKLKTAGLQP